jgi:thymidylate kinase
MYFNYFSKIFKLSSRVFGRVFADMAYIIQSVGIAIDKDRKFRIANAAKKAGMVVICDRFPQTFVDGICDGLRLNNYSLSRNPLLKKLAEWERSIYSKRETIYPDIIFKLEVDTAVDYERRKDTKDASTLEMNNNLFNKIPMPEHSRIVKLDNNNTTLHDLQKKTVGAIWNGIIDASLK